MTAIAVITPTCGRATIRQTIASAVTQFGAHDRMVIVGDGPQLQLRDVWTIDPRITYLETPQTGGYGAAQRDAGIAYLADHAIDYLLFVDDDDVLNAGMLDVVRSVVAENPRKLHLFRCAFYGYRNIEAGTVLWRAPLIVDGNVGTGMIACPNVAGLPSWTSHGVDTYNADYHFIHDTAQVFGVIWRTEILQTTRPQ